MASKPENLIIQSAKWNVDYVKRIRKVLLQSSWLLPLVGILVFFIITAIHFVMLQDQNGGDSVHLGDSLAVKREAWKRLWSVGSTMFFLAAIGSIIHSSYVLTRLKLPRIVNVLLVVVCAAWLISACNLWYQTDTGFGFGMGGEYALKVLDGLQSTDIAKQVAKTLLLSSSLGIVALVFFVAAACGLCHPKDSGKAEDLAERVRLFFHLMYLSVGLTLTAIWMIFCLFHWAAAMASADEAKNATVIADMVVLCAGIFYSVILVIAFVPTAVVLQRMIEVAFRTNLNSENGFKYDEWKDVVGLSEMPLSTMKTYVALGAPMIGGLFAALMKSFFG